MVKKNMTNNESANVQNAQVSNPANETPMMKAAIEREQSGAGSDYAEREQARSMSKQFKQLKEKNPDALLLFRCGDFYESYEDDAKVVSEVLGITLTKASNGTQMAGFPYHALDTYLPKIIRARHRVAICDQLEDPKLTKKKEPVKVDEYSVKDDKGNDVKFESVAPSAICEQPVEDPAPSADEDVVDTTDNNLPQVEYSTYKTKKGGTAPQIIGFGGEDDPRWKAHKDAGHKWVSASYRRDLNGNKVYILLFGTRYIDVAKALAGAYNTTDVDAWHRAEDACTAIYEQAQRDGKARWEEKKAQWAEKKAEKAAQKAADEQAKKCYTKEDVAAMMQTLLNGGDVPEEIKAMIKAA